MSIEAPRKIIRDAVGFGVYATGQFALPLYNHKRESDKAGKHQEWTSKKHFTLTGLAVLVDLGFNFATAILAIYGNYKEADMTKIAHVIGADAIPETLTNLKNKVANRLEKRRMP